MQLSGPRSLLNNGDSRFSSVTEDRQRTGSVLLEFILAFPLILIISLAIIEFGFFALL
tara:strand:- start:30 stop:203 length:174 start_codon:yes stop_codon:yes gene_type:complete